jgi:protein SCO1/2
MSRLAALFALLLLIGCSQPTHFYSTDISGADFGREFPAPLTDHTGRARRLAEFKGKAVVIFFGYTQCPDVCPTTLSAMTEALRLLGDDGQKVQVLFITIDPERDTRELLAAYVPQFHPSFIGLRADLASTAATALEFKIFYQKQPGSSPTTYSVDHSANSYVYDPQGHLRLFVKHGEAPEKIAADIKVLLAGK